MSTKASNISDSAPSPRQPNKTRQSRLVNVDGLGRKYEGLLQQQGIRTVDQLAEIILDKLSRPNVAAQQTSKQQGNGALAYLRVSSTQQGKPNQVMQGKPNLELACYMYLNVHK